MASALFYPYLGACGAYFRAHAFYSSARLNLGRDIGVAIRYRKPDVSRIIWMSIHGISPRQRGRRVRTMERRPVRTLIAGNAPTSSPFPDGNGVGRFGAKFWRPYLLFFGAPLPTVPDMSSPNPRQFAGNQTNIANTSGPILHHLWTC